MKTMIKVLVAFFAIFALSLPASAASAHTSAVTGEAVCLDDGTYEVIWTYNATNVPYGVEAETKAMTTNKGALAPIDGVNKGGQIFLSVWSEHQINVPGAPVKTTSSASPARLSAVRGLSPSTSPATFGSPSP